MLAGPFTGLRVSASSDLTGDGTSDVMIAAPGLNGEGAVYLFDGNITGAVGADQASASFQGEAGDVGEGLAACGDVDGDGNSDLAVGMPWGNNGRGGVYLLSGPLSGEYGPADATRLPGSVVDSATGYTVTCNGDFTDDGLADLLIGAPYTEGFGVAVEGGTVYFRSGTDDFIANFSTAYSDSHMGLEQSLAMREDLNGDGLDDVVLGASGASRVHMMFAPFQGTYDSNAPMAVYIGREEVDGMGHALDVGDLNGDGYADLAVGAPTFDRKQGSVGILLGPFAENDTVSVASEGNWLDGQDPLELAGYSVVIAGDLNGDNMADLIVGAPGAVTSGKDAGVVYIIYGPGELQALSGADVVLVGTTEHGRFGTSIAAVPDATGDNLHEVLIGAPYTDVDNKIGVGAAYLFHSPLASRAEQGDASATFIF